MFNKSNLQALDKSIIAMGLLLLQKKTGDKKIGPNRDDLPVFLGLLGRMMRKDPMPKDLLFMARHRVKKYHRQLSKSSYWNNINDASFSRNMMLEQYSRQTQILSAEKELAEFINEGSSYGHW